LLDRYILAKLGELVADVTADLEALDSPLAAAKLRDFADVLTNWYVRRSRDRFWDGTDTDAFDTLFTVLETVARVAAPLIPLIAEEVWRGLTGGRSVHLENWPDAELFPRDHDLVVQMDAVREIASAGLALRKARSLRVRLPLSKLTIVSDSSGFDGASQILRDELNLKAVAFEALDEGSLDAFGITRKLTVNARALGPRLGKQVQEVIKAARAGDWASTSPTTVVVGGHALEPGEFELELEAVDASNAIAFLSGGGFVILDTEMTPQLEAEGLARDVIRAIQDTRKAAGLDVSDRITLAVRGSSGPDIAALESHAATIAAETLATASTFEITQQPELDSILGSDAGQRAILAAGQYSNSGVLVIDVWKSGAVHV